MSVKYKIGDVSKLLGIPAQTLRYFEEQEIVHPQKDAANGYRYYDAWNLNNLIDSVHYRSLDFSLNQTKEILNTDDLDSIREKYSEQESFLKDKIQEYMRKLEIVIEQQQKIQHFEKNLGEFVIQQCPDLLFYRHRLKDTFQSKQGDQSIDAIKPGMQVWMNEIPNVTPTFIVMRESLGSGYTDMQYWWGWSMPMKRAAEEQLMINEYNEHIPIQKCLYTVFEAGDKGTFAGAFYHQVYEEMKDSKYTIAGDPVGRLIMKSHDSAGMHRYFETWVPIA